MKINRMVLADIFSPQALAISIIRQLKGALPPIPIEEIAYAVGIKKITQDRLDNIEGVLVSNAEKTTGAILVNSKSGEERKRFTIGHELGHFLIWDHFPERADHFLCTKEDMRERDTSQKVKRMEAEANAFSANLLMPSSLFRKDVKDGGNPSIGNIIILADRYKTSKEATANRYANIIDQPCAVVFSKDDVIRYAIPNGNFAWLKFKKGDAVPNHIVDSNRKEGIEEISEVKEQKGFIWCEENQNQLFPEYIFEQTMAQQKGYRMTLLYYDKPINQEDYEEEINEERENIDSWKIGF